MEISILEHVTGTYGKLKRQEDKWINRLGSLSPSGMNLHTSDFGFIHKSLFNQFPFNFGNSPLIFPKI